MIKAIFFDIDGTLLSFKTRLVPESAKRALQMLREKGIRLFICTGRPPVLIDNIRRQLAGMTFDGMVMLNGQYCVDEAGNVFFEQALPRETFDTLLPWMEQNPEFCCCFAEIDRMYMNNITDAVRERCYAAGLGDPHAPLGDPTRARTHTIYQINPYIPPEEDEEFLRHAPGCRAVRWNAAFADVIPADGGKPEGVRRMLARHGLTREECMAFGDGGNDIEMLQYAGIGVAMGNAAPEVQAAADYVTDDIDADGIANALAHFGLL